jgi:hypothetical protein
MTIKHTVAGALALLVPCVPSLASAQPVGSPCYGNEPFWAGPGQSVTAMTVVPPAYGSVFVYEGRRLVGRFDGSGALWLPTGRLYRIVAMRGEQVLWNGNVSTTGAPVELRWPGAPMGYQRRPLTPPVEEGRVRTPILP